MHSHVVHDDDVVFVIDSETRSISNAYGDEESIVLMQNDHNSERFTFELPRYIEGHDMTECNIVQVHYNNVSKDQKNSSPGVYDIEDLHIDPDDDSIVVGSWLVSQNATRNVGTLNFVLRFACSKDGKILYQWYTKPYGNVLISDTIDNNEAIVELNADVLEQWATRLFDPTRTYVEGDTLYVKNKWWEVVSVSHAHMATNADRADCDTNGNVIHETYSTKSDISKLDSTDGLLNERITELEKIFEEINNDITTTANDINDRVTAVISGKEPVYSAIRDADGNVIGESYIKKSDPEAKSPIVNGYGVCSVVMNARDDSLGDFAIGDYSMTSGYCTNAEGESSSANGNNTIACINDQFVVGTYNEYDPDKMEVDDALFVVGNGTSSKRSNALEIGMTNSAIYTKTNFKDDIIIGGIGTSVVRYSRNSTGNSITIPLSSDGYLCVLRAWYNNNSGVNYIANNGESMILLTIPPRDVVVDAKGTDLTIGTLTTLSYQDSSSGVHRVYLYCDSETGDEASLRIDDDETAAEVTLDSVTIFPIGFTMPRYEYPVG